MTRRSWLVAGLVGALLLAHPALARDAHKNFGFTFVGAGSLLLGALVCASSEDKGSGYSRQGLYAGLGATYAVENFGVQGPGGKALGIAEGERSPGQNPPPLSQDSPFDRMLDERAELFDAATSSDAGGLNAVFGYRCHPRISHEVEFGYYPGFVEKFNGGDGLFDGGPADPPAPAATAKLGGWVLTANAKIYILTGRVQPYVKAGLGAIHFRRKGAGQRNFHDTDVAARAGGGVDFYVTEDVVLSLDGTYMRPQDAFGGFDFAELTFGVKYRFGGGARASDAAEN